MRIDVLNFCLETLCLVLINVLFCLFVIQKHRFSMRTTGILAFTGFLLLFLPQLVFPSFFLKNTAVTTSGFVLHAAYWTFFICGQFFLYFLLTKRNWTQIFLLSVCMDILMSILVSLLLSAGKALKGSAFIDPAITLVPSVFTLMAVILTLVLLCTPFFRRLRLIPWLSNLIVLIYSCSRLGVSMIYFQIEKPLDETFVLSTVFSVIGFLILLIFLAAFFTIAYGHWKSRGWEKDADLDRLYTTIRRHCQNRKVSFSFHISKESKPLSVNGVILYTLYLVLKNLVDFACVSDTEDSSSIYCSIQEQFNCVIICSGCIRKAPVMHKRRGNEKISLRPLIRELLLNVLLKQAHGRIQYLDDNDFHCQIRLIFPLIAVMESQKLS